MSDFADAGLCDIGGGPPRGRSTGDDIAPWVVLFADLLDVDAVPLSLDAVVVRAAEWRALFAGGPQR